MSEAVAKDLTAGTFAGVAQLLVGHPFDTIKVKLQSQPAPLPGQPPKYAGAIDAVKQTLASEGPKGLYKGMGAPLATVAVFNAVLFTARGQMEALLRDAPGAHLTVGQQMIAGECLVPALHRADIYVYGLRFCCCSFFGPISFSGLDLEVPVNANVRLVGIDWVSSEWSGCEGTSELLSANSLWCLMFEGYHLLFVW